MITAVNYSLLRWIDNLFPIIFYVSFVVMLESVISKQFTNDSYTSFVSLHAWGVVVLHIRIQHLGNGYILDRAAKLSNSLV